jgi:hypothetical protein
MPKSIFLPKDKLSPFWSGWPHIIASIKHNVLLGLDVG